MKVSSRRGRIFSLIVAGLGLFGITAMSACHRIHSPEEKAQFMLDRLESKLDLDESQLAIAKEFTTAATRVMHTVKAQRKTDIADLINALTANKVEANQIKSIYQSRIKAIDGEIDLLAESIAKLMASLNEEQRQDLVQMLNKISTRINRS